VEVYKHFAVSGFLDERRGRGSPRC